MEDLIRELIEKNRSLHQIIINNSNQSDEIPLDETIMKEFETLNTMIKRLVHSCFRNRRLYTRATPDDKVASARRCIFTKESLNYPGELWYLWLRGVIACNLYETFFSSPMFGLANSTMEKYMKIFEEQLQECTTSMMNFFFLLYDMCVLIGSPVSPAQVAEWRVCTIRASRHLVTYNTLPHLVTNTAEFLYETLGPMITRANRAKVIDDMNEICKKAFQTALLFRTTIIKYTWEFVARERVVNGSTMEVIGELSNKSNDVVVFTVFGGIFKYPKTDADGSDSVDGRPVILRKVDVVV